MRAAQRMTLRAAGLSRRVRYLLTREVKEDLRFVIQVVREFDRDGCAQAAGALSYTTVLALVPMFAVMLATLTLVPALYDWHIAIENFIFANFIPASGVQVQAYVSAFVEQAESLQTVGLAALAFSVIAMMATVEATFNAIWKVTTHRSWWHRGWLYIAILGLGPLALTAGIAASALAVSLPLVAPHLERAPFAIALELVPFLAIWLTFAACYKLIPYRAVAWRHAFNGGAVAALFFETAKRGFALYIDHFPQQEKIYGAFAAVPLFLIWIYLSWLVVLFGAEFTHAFGQRVPTHGPATQE